jgi:hypothetical protein
MNTPENYAQREKGRRLWGAFSTEATTKKVPSRYAAAPDRLYQFTAHIFAILAA